MTSFWKLKAIFLSSVLISTVAIAQPRIDLTEGTLFINGGFIFQYDVTGFEDVQHSFGLRSDLGGGYFIIDYLAIGFSIPAQWKFSPASGGGVGVKAFVTYHFETNSAVFPYVGVNVTPGYNLTKRSFELKAGLDAGVLVSLSDNIALDFGLRPEVGFKLFDKDKWEISIPGGFFGIRAFF